jgi:hypothetical protein
LKHWEIIPTFDSLVCVNWLYFLIHIVISCFFVGQVFIIFWVLSKSSVLNRQFSCFSHRSWPALWTGVPMVVQVSETLQCCCVHGRELCWFHLPEEDVGTIKT